MPTTSIPSRLRDPSSGGEAPIRWPAFAWLARAGLVARGVVYGVVGVLSLQLALGAGGRTTSQQGALKTIARQPFGKALLITLTIGLAGYALWRLARAAIGHGAEAKDTGAERVAAAASGLAYAGLCFTAVEILAGAGTTGSSNPKQAAGGVLGWTGGTEIVAVAGAVLIGVALYQGYKGISREFLKTSDTARMSPRVKRAFTALGVFGHLARMVVFGLVGFGVSKAALDYNPHTAIGLDGALSKLAHHSYGPLLLGVVAAGLIGFALYSIVDSRYRKV